MAMPFILHHDENIYSLDAKEIIRMIKPPRHVSKYRQQVATDAAHQKCVNKTMGYAEVPLDPPSQFLKRGGGVKPKRPSKDHVCYHKNLPALPKFGGQQKKGGGGGEDGNGGGDESGGVAGEVEGEGNNNGGGTREKPLKTIRKIPRYVDSNRGDTHDLKSSGLMPVYVYQTKFGQTPKYLLKRNRDVAKQEVVLREAMVRKPMCRSVTQTERAELLSGLKQNWEDMQKIYQGLPILTDTIPKALRKTKLENNLKALEKDILLVENLPHIYVHNSDGFK